MPLPTVAGTRTIAPWACETFWIYCDRSVPSVTVAIDGGSSFAATAGTDPNGVAGFGFLIAGADCAAPGTAVVLAAGSHPVKWWTVQAPETHAGDGFIIIGG
jgi:hypothetical protein